MSCVRIGVTACALRMGVMYVHCVRFGMVGGNTCALCVYGWGRCVRMGCDCMGVCVCMNVCASLCIRSEV